MSPANGEARMNRLFLTIGSLAVEVVALGVDSMLAGAVCVAGMIVSAVHCVCSGSLFRVTIDRLTGCHLPESLGDRDLRRNDASANLSRK